MADYIYLLENRLSRAQREALHQVRDTARAHGMTVFLVGGAVRDLTSGAPIRDLNFAVQGDARQLGEDLGRGGRLLGSNDLMQSLYFSFPGGVRLEVGSTLNVAYPQPGKPAVQPASMLEDLRRRDFTANAMAISLNEGSYGLLMDPTNGVADVENRELRLLSNYGFLEEPSRMIRVVRLSARLGWQMEERTQTRYDNAKSEGYISALGEWERRYEAEAIFREEDPLRVMRKLEEQGWLTELTPILKPSKTDEAELDRLREIVGQLNTLGIFPDTSAAVFPLLAAKLTPAEVAQLKTGFALSGFAGQIEALEESAKALAGEFTSRANTLPSSSWKLLMAAEPEPVLWMAFSSKGNAVQSKLKLFFNEWPQARQKVPYQQMQEMRITPDLPGYDALLSDLFFAAMDGKLDSTEAIKTFLEPFSPPAAPPPPTLRRRAVKRESKTAKSRAKKAVAETLAIPTEGDEAVVGSASEDKAASAEAIESGQTTVVPPAPPAPPTPALDTAGSAKGRASGEARGERHAPPSDSAPKKSAAVSPAEGVAKAKGASASVQSSGASGGKKSAAPAKAVQTGAKSASAGKSAGAQAKTSAARTKLSARPPEKAKPGHKATPTKAGSVRVAAAAGKSAKSGGKAKQAAPARNTAKKKATPAAKHAVKVKGKAPKPPVRGAARPASKSPAKKSVKGKRQ